MQNPGNIRYLGRIVGTLAGFGAALVVILVLAVVMTLIMSDTGGTAAEKAQTTDTFMYIGAFIAFIVLGVVYRRVRGRFNKRADEIERQAAQQPVDMS